ncbi:hypothetical protein ACFL1S_02675 [Pseudomonadota bacterium]
MVLTTVQGPALAVAIVFTLLAATPAAVNAEAPDEAEEQEYVSIRADIWSRHLRTIENDGYQARLVVALATGLYRYRTLDDLFDDSIEHINSIGVRPKMEYEIPTSIRNVSFVPELELALNRSLDTSNKVLSAAATAGLLHRRKGDDKDIRTRVRVRYGSEYELDGLNSDDYLELSLKVFLQEQHGFRIGERNLTVTPFGEIRRYTDSLEFATESGAIFDVTTQYELGLEFSTAPRKKILGIALPRIRLSFAFGDDFRGFLIRL